MDADPRLKCFEYLYKTAIIVYGFNTEDAVDAMKEAKSTYNLVMTMQMENDRASEPEEFDDPVSDIEEKSKQP